MMRILHVKDGKTPACEWHHTALARTGAMLRAMLRYRLCSRVVAVAENLYHVAVTATREDTPRDGVIARRQECGSRDGAEQLRDILVNQVCTAVESTGGCVVALEAK
jgi:hypothetical protein